MSSPDPSGLHLGMYKCNECHTGTFPLKSGNKPVTMSEMQKSKSCGVCHDGSTAFTVSGNCDSCHVKKRKIAQLSE